MTKMPKIPKRVSRAIDRMQTAASKAGVDALFAATSEQLGAAAVEGARRIQNEATKADYQVGGTTGVNGLDQAISKVKKAR